MKSFAVCFLRIITIALFAGAVLAQQEPHIQLKNEAFKEKLIVKEDGSEEYELIPPGLAIPGDEIIYISTFVNIGKEDVTDIVITNPVPNNSLYKVGTAFGSGTEITFSVDGGKTYAKPEALKIKDTQGVPRTATAKDYTAIRWVFKGSLKPGEESTVTFRTILQ